MSNTTVDRYGPDGYMAREYEPDPECPACGGPATVTTWPNDGEVETAIKCRRCTYEEHYMFGQTTVTVGGREWRWMGSTPHDEVERYEAEIEQAIEREKANP